MNSKKRHAKMTMERQRIEIPEGFFGGNCSDCLYANHRDTDAQGRVRCNGGIGGYNHPSDRNGCFDYEKK